MSYTVPSLFMFLATVVATPSPPPTDPASDEISDRTLLIIAVCAGGAAAFFSLLSVLYLSHTRNTLNTVRTTSSNTNQIVMREFKTNAKSAIKSLAERASSTFSSSDSKSSDSKPNTTTLPQKVRNASAAASSAA